MLKAVGCVSADSKQDTTNIKTIKTINRKAEIIMNRSSRGFGLIGVFVAVVVMIVSAVVSTSASSSEPAEEQEQQKQNK